MSFKEINNLHELDSYRDWNPVLPVAQFLIDNHGDPISGSYTGPVYRLIGDYDKEYTLFERITRAVLGIFSVLLTLGFALCSQNVRNLFLNTKQVMRLGMLETKVESTAKTEESVEEAPTVPILKNFPKDSIGVTHKPIVCEHDHVPDRLIRGYHHIEHYSDSNRLEVTKVNKHGKLVEKAYLLDRKLGKGGFGNVFELIPQTLAGKHKALKIAHPNTITEARLAMEKGKRLLDKQFVDPNTGVKQNSIPGILNYKHIDFTKGFALSKFCSGSMLSVIKTEQSFEFYCRYVAQTAFAVNHFHTESTFKPGLIHRDLKPENIIYLASNNSPNFFIIDYDGSQEMNDLIDHLSYTKEYLSKLDLQAWKQDHTNKNLNAAMDVRLLGLCWAEVITGTQITQQKPQVSLTKDFLINAVHNKRKFSAKQLEQLDKICDLILFMTSEDWTLRPSMPECLQYLATFEFELPAYKN